MAGPQAQLTTRLAEQFSLSVIRFRHFDSLVLGEGAILKLFVPRSRRILGGQARDRVLDGELLFTPRDALVPLRAGSARFEAPESVCGCPIANFPWLLRNAVFDDERADPRLLEGLFQLAAQMPDDEHGWRTVFGDKVFDSPRLDMTVRLVNYLRNATPSRA
jgi:hypothetical protein